MTNWLINDPRTPPPQTEGKLYFTSSSSEPFLVWVTLAFYSSSRLKQARQYFPRVTCGIYDNVLHVSYIKYLAPARMDELLSGSEAMIRKKLSTDADSCDARCNRCRLDWMRGLFCAARKTMKCHHQRLWHGRFVAPIFLFHNKIMKKLIAIQHILHILLER